MSACPKEVFVREPSKSQEGFCGTSHWVAMPARLKFLTVSPARLERFAGAPRNFAARPEGGGRVF